MIKEKYFITIVCQTSSSILILLANFFLILNLEIKLFGIWVFLLSVINLGFLFIDISFDTIYLQYSGKENSAEYFGAFFIIKIICLLLNIFISLIIIMILELLHTPYFILIIYLLFSKILISITNIFSINLKSKIKIFKVEIPLFLINFGKSISIIYLTLNLKVFSDPLFYLSISNFIFDLILILVILTFSKNEFILKKPKRNIIFDFIKDAEPLIFYSVILVIATNLGYLIIFYSYGERELSYFGFINNYVITFLLSISASIIQLTIVLFSKYHENKDFSSIRDIIYILEKYFSIFFLSIIIIVYLNGKQILHLMLPEYIASIDILYIMIFIPFLTAITRPYAFSLTSGKKQRLTALINSIVNITIIILMIILIPKNIFGIRMFNLGIIGGAIAQTLPLLLWFLFYRYYSHKHFSIKPQKKILLHVFLAFFSFLIGSVLKIFLFEHICKNELLLIFTSSILCLTIFLGFLVFFKQLNKKDIKLMCQLITLRNHKSTLYNEFLT